MAKAIQRLEAAGLIKVTRRLKRVKVDRSNPVTGLPETVILTVQDSNLYAFADAEEAAGRIDTYAEAYAPPRTRSVDILKRILRRFEAESAVQGESPDLYLNLYLWGRPKADALTGGRA